VENEIIGMVDETVDEMVEETVDETVDEMVDEIIVEIEIIGTVTATVIVIENDFVRLNAAPLPNTTDTLVLVVVIEL
jgi:hypothetical protein